MEIPGKNTSTVRPPDQNECSIKPNIQPPGTNEPSFEVNVQEMGCPN